MTLALDGVERTVVGAPTTPLLVVDSPSPDPNAELNLDLARLLVSRILIAAASGSGKSWALRYLLEQTQDRVLQLVLDHEGEFATLRERHPYLLVGSKGEIPAIPSQAHLLARRLMNLGSSAILDLSDLPIPERQLFVKGFCEGLIDLPEAEWRSVLVFLDEVQIYAPETGRGESIATAAVSNLANLGRKRGQGLVAATQRFANVHNNVLAALQNVLIGMTVLDTDVARASRTLGFSKPAQRQRLLTMEPGEFFAFGPALCKLPTLVHTGMVQTTHPRPGTPMPPVPPAPEAIRALAAQLTDLGQAAAEDLDLETARARIMELERQLARSAPVQASPQIEYVDRPVPVLEQAQVDALSEMAHVLGGDLRQVVELLATVNRELLRWRVPSEPTEPIPAPVEQRNAFKAADPSPPPVSALVLAESTPVLAEPTGSTEERTNGAAAPGRSASPLIKQRILNVLARLAALGLEHGVDRRPVAHFCGYADPTTRTWRDAVADLKDEGLLMLPRAGHVALTPAGMARAEAPQLSIRSVEDHQRAWYEWLPEVETRVLRVLVSAYPVALQRAALARDSGYADPTTRSFRDAVARLIVLGLVAVAGKGEVVATPLIVPEIRPRARARAAR